MTRAGGASPAADAPEVDGQSLRRVLDALSGHPDSVGLTVADLSVDGNDRAGGASAAVSDRAVEGAGDDEAAGRDPAPGGQEWYRLRGVVEALEEFAARAGDEAVTGVGRDYAALQQFDAEAPTVPAVLVGLAAWHDRHHRGHAGEYAFRQIGPTDGRVECATRYPCAFDRGFVEGAALARADRFVCLSEVGRCRADGADRCTYDLSW